MNPEVIIPDSKPNTEVSDLFHHFVGGYVLGGLPCIITIDNTVFVHDEYSLIDFTDNGGFIERKVRFFEAYLRGYNVTIVVQDMDTGDLIKRQHRLNNDSLPCNWVLTDYFNTKTKEDDLLEFCF